MVKQAILLAGGLASRLGPVTQVTNKHLLPIYDKPMIFYGLETLRDIGIKEVTIILGGNSVGDIVNLIKDGSAFDLNVTYKYQQKPKGISHAISLAEHEINNDKFIVLLGDNVFADGAQLTKYIDFWNTHRSDYALVVLTKSDNPQQYGQPLLTKDGEIFNLVEKSTKPLKHNLVIPGFYGLTHEAFSIIKLQKPSARGELEIVDTLRQYLGRIAQRQYDGFYTDCGTPDGLLKASNYFGSVGQ